MQTPHRFRSKQLWTYSGLGLETRDSGQYRWVQGQLQRRKKQVTVRGWNKDHNLDLKALFKSAATRASVQPGAFEEFYRPGRFLVCRAFTRYTSKPRSSRTSYNGIQYTPVDCITTVFTPQLFDQSAR